MAMESGLKARLVTGVVLALVFGSGVTAGLAWEPTPGTARTAEPAQAEDQGGERERRERGDRSNRDRRPLLVEQVGLTVDQKTQVDEIVENSRQRMRTCAGCLREPAGPSATRDRFRSCEASTSMILG